MPISNQILPTQSTHQHHFCMFDGKFEGIDMKMVFVQVVFVLVQGLQILALNILLWILKGTNIDIRTDNGYDVIDYLNEH